MYVCNLCASFGSFWNWISDGEQKEDTGDKWQIRCDWKAEAHLFILLISVIL
jgi:hypothetical protein